MPNGSAGDHPITDIVHHQQPTWSPKADRLVQAIVDLGGRDAIEALFNVWAPPPVAEIEQLLEGLHQRVLEDARSRGWEV